MEDSAGKAKSAEQLIKEVSEIWDELSDAQRRNTSVGVAGIHQLSRWNALMLNYKMGVSATETALNSYGSAMREQEKYNQSLQARLNNLSTAWYGFADALGNTIVYDTLVFGTTLLETLTKTADSSVGSLGLMALSISALATPLLFVSTRFTGLTTNILSATMSKTMASAASTTLTGKFYALATGATVAGTAIRGLMIATGVGAVIAALTTGVGFLINKFSEAKQESEEFEVYLNKNKLALTENKDEVDNLISSFDNLSKQQGNVNWDTEKEQEYLDIQNRLGELFPSIIDYVDSNGNSHIKSKDAINHEIEAVNKLIEAEKKLRITQAEDTFKKANKDIESLIGQKKGLEATLKLKVDRGSSEKEIAKLELDILQLEKKIADSSAEIRHNVMQIADDFLDVGQTINSTVIDEINKALNNIDLSNLNSQELKDFSKELSSIMVAMSVAMENGDTSGFDIANSNLTELLNTLGLIPNNSKDVISSFDDLTKAIEEVPTLTPIDESLEDVGDSADDLAKKIEDLAKKAYDLKSAEEQLVGVSNTHVESSKEQLYIYEQLTARMQGYNDEQIKELMRKPQLTAEEKLAVQAYRQREQVLQQLMVLYPEYARLQEGAISLSAQQVKAMKDEEKANKVLLEAYKLSSEGKYSAEQDMTLIQAQATKARIDNIKSEIMAMDILNQELQKYIKNLSTARKPDESDEEYRRRLDNEGKAAMRAGSITENNNNAISGRTSELSKLQSELNSTIGTIDGYNNKINDSSKATKKSSKAAKESSKTTKDSIYITDKYKKSMEALTLAIEKQQALQNKYPSHSESYRKALQAEIKLQEQQIKLQKDQAASLEKQIKNRKIAQTGNVTVGETTKAKVSGFGGRLTSKQGYRTHPVTGKRTYHAGIDIASPLGTRLDSNVNGKVVKQSYNSISGNHVQIQDSNGVKHFFGHLQKALVKVGDIVKTGQQIGKIGSTGRSTGSHLHYEVKDKNGKQLDAMSYAKEAMSGLVVSSKTVKDTISTTQESVDNTQSTLNGIYSSIEKDEEKLANLRQRNASWTIDEYNANRRKILDEELAHEEAKLTNLEVGSERYNKTLENQTNLLKRKQKVNKDDLKYVEDQIKNGKLSAIQLDEYKNRAVALKTEAHELDQVLQNSALRKYDLFDNLREAPTNEIEVLRAKMELLDDDTLSYSESLDDVIVGLREIQNINQKELIDLEKDIKSGSFTGQALEDLEARYEELKLTILNINSEIRNTFYESSKVKFNINNKSIKKTQDEIDFLNYKLSMLDETDITTKVSVMFDIQNNLTTSISKMDNAIKDAIIMRNDAIAMGLGTDVYDDEIDSIIGQRRNQLTEMQNTYNQMQSIVSDAKNKIKEAEDNAYSEASKDIDKTIKRTEKNLRYFSDLIEDFNRQMELLQESDYDEKIGILTNQLSQSRQLASQIVSEYYSLASTPVYNEEQKEKVESQLEGLKNQLADVNSETINYTKNLEKIKFNKLLSGANKSQKELNRLLDALEGNVGILEGGRLSGTDIDLDLNLPEGNVLDLSTLIDNPADNLQAQELQIQDIRSSSYGSQITEAEKFHEEMKEQAEKFQSVMMDAVEKFEKMVLTLTEISDKEKQKEKEKANEELLKSTKKLSKEELETLQKHYKNIKDNMLDSMGEYKDDFGGIWDDIIADLDSKLKIIENSLSNIGSGVEVSTPPVTTTPPTSTKPSTGSNNNSGNSGSKPTSPTKPSVNHTNDGNLTKADYASNHKVEFIKKSVTDKDTAYVTFTNGKSPVKVNYVKNPSDLRTYFNNDEAYQIFINAHAKGTDGSSGGLSLVGEEGTELVVQKDGSAYLTGNSHELRNLQRGDKVFTADETKKMLTDKKTPIPAFAEGTPKAKNQKLDAIPNYIFNLGTSLSWAKESFESLEKFMSTVQRQLSFSGGVINSEIESLFTVAKAIQDKTNDYWTDNEFQEILKLETEAPLRGKSNFKSWNDSFVKSIDEFRDSALSLNGNKIISDESGALKYQDTEENGKVVKGEYLKVEDMVKLTDLFQFFNFSSKDGKYYNTGFTDKYINDGTLAKKDAISKINYSKDYTKQNEEYEKAREPRVKKITDLQAQLDEAELKNNKAEEDRLTKIILDETNQLNREDYNFNYSKTVDLIKESSSVATKAILDLKNLKKTEKLTEETKAEIDEEIARQYSLINSLTTQQKDAVSKLLEAQVNYWIETNSKYTDKIDDLEYERDMLDEDDTTGKLRVGNEILEQQKLYTQSLEKQKKELEDLLKTQEVGTYEWNQTKNTLKDVNESIEDATLSLKNMSKELENTVDDIIDIVKDGIEKERKLVVAELNKRLNDIEEVYRSKLDAIGDRESERTYLNSREDVEDEITKLQKNINRLSLNDSQEAIARRLDLEKQLSDKKAELAELDYQRSVEMERKAIEDSRDAKKEAIDKEIEYHNWLTDELLANERFFANMREEILKGNISEVSGYMQLLLNSFYKYNESSAKELGESFQEILNTIDKIAKAYKNIDSNNSKLNESQIEKINKDDAELKKNEPKKYNNDKVYYTILEGKKIGINKDDSATIKAFVDAGYDLYEYGATAPLSKEEIKKNYGFFDGGLTSSTGLHWLDGTLAKPEIVLNSNDTKNLLEAVKSVRGISDFTNLNLPKFDMPKFDIANSGVSHTYNLDFKFDNFSGSQQDGNFVMNKVMTNLKKLGR